MLKLLLDKLIELYSFKLVLFNATLAVTLFVFAYPYIGPFEDDKMILGVVFAGFMALMFLTAIVVEVRTRLAKPNSRKKRRSR